MMRNKINSAFLYLLPIATIFFGCKEESPIVYCDDAILFNAVLSPNPTEGPIALSFVSAIQDSVSIKVFNINGLALHTKLLKPVKGENQEQLDLSEYEDGIYFISISVITIPENEGIISRILKK